MKKNSKIILIVLGSLLFIFMMLSLATMNYFEEVPDSNASLAELSQVNDQIIAYFQSDNITYDNYSYNYVDELRHVVVVGLLDNSKEKQDEFRKLVVDSEYLKFEKGDRMVNYK